MNKTTRKNARVIFSAIAVLACVTYMVLEPVRASEAYRYTFGWRSGIFNNVFLFIPFLALVVFSFMEKELKHVNKRNFVIGIFFLHLVQSILAFFGNHLTSFDLFINYALKDDSVLVYTILIARVMMLFLVPKANAGILKGYSLGVIGVMLGILGISVFHMFLLGERSYMLMISMMPELVFHLALYFFGDLMTADNKTSMKKIVCNCARTVADILLSEEDDDDKIPDELDFDELDFNEEDEEYEDEEQ